MKKGVGSQKENQNREDLEFISVCRIFPMYTETSCFPRWGKNPKAASKTGIGRVGESCSYRSKGHGHVDGAASVGTGIQCGSAGDLFPAPGVQSFMLKGHTAQSSGTGAIQLLPI